MRVKVGKKEEPEFKQLKFIQTSKNTNREFADLEINNEDFNNELDNTFSNTTNTTQINENEKTPLNDQNIPT